MNYRKIGIIGGGAWGTALAQTMRRAQLDVVLWAYELETVEEINGHHCNRTYLPGVALDPMLLATGKARDLANCDALLMVVPTQFMGAIGADIAPHVRDGTPVLICAKGFEEASGRFMSEVLGEVMPQARIGILSGPSFAAEVGRNLPAALTLATSDERLGGALIAALSHRTFRLYWTDDLKGVQIGGSVKNVLAIAAGIVAGRELGDSAHAALTTRGFAELMRFGVALGGRGETLTGLSGLGDLMLTCSSAKSRNMSLGMALGRGETLEQVLGGRKSVSEGVHTATSVVALARQAGIDMPICSQVHSVLTGTSSVDEAIEALLTRPARAEAGAAAQLAG